MELAGEIIQLICRYESGSELLKKCLRDISEALLDVAPAPRKWSVRQITVHVCDTEFVMGHRIRLMIAEPGSRVLSFHSRLTLPPLCAHPKFLLNWYGCFHRGRGGRAV